jgi:hypothetical protein
MEPFTLVNCPICGTAVRARTQFNNFTLQDVLGVGGMGAVYRAKDANLNRVVALKVVKKEFSGDPEYISRFEAEAQITASVNHPHVVKVFSFGSSLGLYYIAMELVDKGSLDDLMNLQERVAEAQALEIGAQIADGLRAAHHAGLIHRDVKPGNILFADAHTAKIVDFGLAILQEREAESRGEVWGTPYYVCPERLDHQPEDHRSDIYSLGGTLFHAIAGRPPFEAESASMVALKHLKSQAVSLQAFAPEVSNATAYVINRMLHKDPEERYETYDELIEHLNYARAEVLAAAAAPARPKARVVVESEETQRGLFYTIIGTIAAILVIGVAIFLLKDRFNPEKTGPKPVAKRAEKVVAEEPGVADEARRLIVEGNFAEAVELVRPHLDKRKKEPRLADAWDAAYLGLAHALDDQPGEARAAFSRGGRMMMALPTKDAHKPDVPFLEKLFEELGKSRAFPSGSSDFFGDDPRGPAGIFLLAMKNWSMREFDEAGPLLDQFLKAKIQKGYEWIGELKPVAQKYFDDYRLYAELKPKADGAATPEAKGAALESLRDAQSKLNMGGALAEHLLKMELKLKTGSPAGARPAS